MNCLIIAAGHGSRLRDVSESKPLTRVTGKPLIEHVVAAAAAGGVRHFTIVTGYRAEQVEAFAATLPARLGVSVKTVRTASWDRPNGHSVLAGAAAIDGDYLLLMADHLFDAAIVRRVVGERSPGADLVLAVDRDIADPRIDLPDATKVEVARDGRIIRIGKALDRFDAIDTGIFLATPALAAAIEADIAAGGGGSLSEGVQRLADRGRAFAADVTGTFWLDVDDARGLALAEALSGSAELRDNAA